MREESQQHLRAVEQDIRLRQERDDQMQLTHRTTADEEAKVRREREEQAQMRRDLSQLEKEQLTEKKDDEAKRLSSFLAFSKHVAATITIGTELREVTSGWILEQSMMDLAGLANVSHTHV